MNISDRQKDQSTEQLILNAARQVFLDKGLDGARMQEIADIAGINKSLLHYYFRNKEKLFEQVFESVAGTFILQVIELLDSDDPLFEKIRKFVSFYYDILNENPFIPKFIIYEINRDPQRLTAMMEHIAGKNIRKNLKKLDESLARAAQEGLIRKTDTRQFIVNMLSLCIFPIVARPIISGIIFRNNEKDYEDFMLKRKEVVADFIINAMKC